MTIVHAESESDTEPEYESAPAPAPGPAPATTDNEARSNTDNRTPTPHEVERVVIDILQLHHEYRMEIAEAEPILRGLCLIMCLTIL